jgi:hypothetical protein
MKFFTLFIASILLSISAKAGVDTIANGGFEQWTSHTGYNDPNSWTTINSITNIIGVYTVFIDSTTVHSGHYSCKLITESAAGQTAPGLITTGTVNTSNNTITGGVPINSRPASLNGWFQYAPVGSDSAQMSITLTKWSSSGDSTMIVGYGTAYTGSLDSTWSQLSVPITYISGVTPDTVLLLFFSSSSVADRVGSTLLLDDLSYGYPSNVLSPTITPGSTTSFCLGDSVLLQADTSSSHTYQWFHSGISIPGATSSSYVARASGNYTVNIDSAGITAGSAPLTVNANPAAVYLTGLNDTVCTTASAITLTGGSPAGGTYGGTGVTGSVFTPSSSVLGLNTVTYTATDANHCTGTALATIRVEDCTGLNNISANSLTVYPNPATNSLTFTADVNMAGYTLKIYDMVGRVVANQVLEGSNSTVNIGQIPSGAYICTITDKQNTLFSQSKINVIK